MKFSPVDFDDEHPDKPYRADNLPYNPPSPASAERPGQITYEQFLEHCQRHNLKPRPIGAFEKGGYLSGSDHHG